MKSVLVKSVLVKSVLVMSVLEYNESLARYFHDFHINE